MPDSLANRRALRRALTVAVIGLLITFSGCAALGGGTDSTPSETETTTDTTTTSTSTTETQSGTAENTTAADGSRTTATTDSGTNAGDGHSHSHGGESASGSDGTNDADGTSDSDEATETGNRSGKMAVVVAANGLPLGELDGGNVSIVEEGHTWQTSANVTLAEALSSFGVDASADRLAYDGTTYGEDANGTGLYYRVDGRTVDPESYTLQDGDQVWVTVETAETGYSVPGDYIPPEQLHVHGPATFVVNGEEVDFSREKYQSGHDRHFHFEGGHADPWHAHSWSVSLKYAFDTLPGIEIAEGTVTYNGTTYRESNPGTNVSIRVDGDPVDPSEYLLKDGDDVRIVVESDESESNGA